MTKGEALILLQKALEESRRDEETAHIDADRVLCDLLVALGHQDVVEVYLSVGKWYA